MELTSAEVDELLGAWALGALDVDERQRVERALASDEGLARRAAALRRAVVELDDRLATDPPAGLRSQLLTHARAEPRAPGEAADPLTVFATQVSALGSLLAELSGDDWERRALPYGWNVHGLVAHLLVIERYTSFRLGLGERSPGGEDVHLELGAADIAAELERPPEQTAGAWSDTANETIDRLRRGDGPAERDLVEFHGWPFTTDGLLIARSFEIWTHADDIRRASGRPTGTPSAAELRSMSRLSVTSLPLLLPLVAHRRTLAGARVVLTGDGGATYDLGDRDGRTTLIVADVLDYCRFAARRLPLEELDHEVEGDPQAAHDLLAAARLFAV